MKIKQAVQNVLAMGLSKVKVAELFGTNTKLIDKIIASDEGDYMVSGRFNADGRMNINLNGLTQLRVYFTTPRNNNGQADYLGFYSAEAVETRKPKLLIEYSID